MTTLRLVPLAAAVVLSACGPTDTPSTPTSTSAPAASCADATEGATAFFHAHPNGPVQLDTSAEARLADHVAAVERACDEGQARAFGADVLEPWSAGRATSRSPDANTDSMTTLAGERAG